MKKFALLITYIYAFCCPLEFILNVFFGSSVKFIAAATVIVIVFYFLIEQKHTIKFTSFQFCLLGWIGLEVLSILWTNVTIITYERTFSYLMMTVFVILLSFFPFDKKELDLLIKFYSLGALLLAIILITVGQVDGSVYTGRMTVSVLGKKQDPNGLSAIFLSGVFYSLYNAIEVKKFRIPYLIAFLIQSIAVFYTGSRGGLVAYAVALLVFIVIKIPSKRKIPAVLGTLGLVVASYFVLQLVLPGNLFDRLFDFSEYFSSGGMGRVEIWTAALEGLKKSPLIGYGITNYIYYFLQVLGNGVAMHNTFLCVAFDVGLIGFVLFIIPFLSTLANAVKHRNALIVAIIVANMAAAFFLDTLHLRFLWNALIFGIIYKNSLESDTKIEIKKERKA